MPDLVFDCPSSQRWIIILLLKPIELSMDILFNVLLVTQFKSIKRRRLLFILKSRFVYSQYSIYYYIPVQPYGH